MLKVIHTVSDDCLFLLHSFRSVNLVSIFISYFKFVTNKIELLSKCVKEK